MPDIKPDINFPRYIFAIGGAGKNLLYTLLEKEWILREILKPKFSATTVDVIIIDTATDEENMDREKITEIERNLQKLDEEYRNDLSNKDKNIGRINIFYRLLTKEMVLQSPYDLIGIGDKVKRATGSSIWWINDPQLGEDWTKKVINRENFRELNFSKGVYRKRAIGKAIYYKAISEGLFDIDLIQTAQVDILVGLGGGTGSGMAFDLAGKLKTIQPTANITLFGVLSTLDESPDEKINSFAMISEIEYGHLNGNTPFKEVILIPMEVTRYPGREKASDEHERLLKEFDETVPYMIISYHNNPAQRIFENIPDYAPFIIATSQLVRYNVESIRRLKEMLIKALQNKDTSLINENDIYNSIKKFVSEFYTEDSKKVSLPDDDKLFIKEERFNKFRMVLEHEFFKELNYSSVMHIKKAVDAGIVGSGSDDVEKQISSIKSEIDTISIGNEGYREDTDSALYKILKRDIENIEVLKDLLNIVNKIPDNIVRDTLKVMIKVDEFSLGRQLNKIREEIDKTSSRNKLLEGSIKSLEEEKREYEERIRVDVERSNQEWKQSERKNLDLLESIDDLTTLLTNDFMCLKDELKECTNRLGSHTKVSNVDTEPIRNIENAADKIYQELEKIGIYYEDKNVIIRSLANLKDLRKAQIEYKKGCPPVDRMISVVIKTGCVKRLKDLKKKIDRLTAELNASDVKVFDIKGSIASVYEYNIKSRTDGKKDEIINAMINRAKETFPKASPILFDNLNILKDPMKRKELNIGDIARSDLGYDEYINNKDNDLKNKREEIAQVSEKVRMFKSLETTLKNTTPIIRSHSENLKSYHNYIVNIGKDVQAMRRAKKDVIRYIMEMQPTNIFRATVSGANINTIIEDQSEELALRQNVQDGIERNLDTRYNILLRRVIETKDHMKRWEKCKVMNSFVTIANIAPESLGSRETIMNAFSVMRENYSEWKCPWGESWGVGLVLFVAGVPLDNIRNVIDPRAGYYHYYKDVDKSGIIFFHHSYMLEEGKFVKRKKIFNIEDENEKKILLQEDNEVKAIFSENYDEIDIKNCIKSNTKEITKKEMNANEVKD